MSYVKQVAFCLFSVVVFLVVYNGVNVLNLLQYSVVDGGRVTRERSDVRSFIIHHFRLLFISAWSYYQHDELTRRP